MLIGLLCLSFVVIIWGTNWLVIKDALQSSPPLFFTGIRLLGGAIAIGAARLCLGYPLRLGCDGKGRLVAVGLLQMAGGLGLSLAGILRIPALDRTWRPLDAGAAGSLATTTGSIALASSEAPDTQPGLGDRLGSRLVGSNGGLLASLGLGAIFAVGWTPCIGIILGGILTMAATSGTVAQGMLLLFGYCLGLGLPFIAIALAYDRAPGLLRPLLRHGRTVSLVGGLLVSAIGVAMVLDLLRLLPRYFQFLTAI